MKITVRTSDMELTYEGSEPPLHILTKFDGKEGKATNYSKPFERVMQMIGTMADKVIEFEKAKK